MSLLKIKGIMKSLADHRPVFHSEDDFKFALAWRIYQAMQSPEIRLEFKPFPDEAMYLDIWLQTTSTPIELKYCTQELDIKWRGERFELTNQKAHTQRRRAFFQDIKRIEQVMAKREDVKRGYVVILTNEPKYWESPSSQQDADCRIHESREIGGDTKSEEDTIILKGSYSLHWEDYSEIGNNAEYRFFRYLVVSI